VYNFRDAPSILLMQKSDLWKRARGRLESTTDFTVDSQDCQHLTPL